MHILQEPEIDGNRLFAMVNEIQSLRINTKMEIEHFALAWIKLISQNSCIEMLPVSDGIDILLPKLNRRTKTLLNVRAADLDRCTTIVVVMAVLFALPSKTTLPCCCWQRPRTEAGIVG
jgi:hypothetical protein